MQASTKNKWTIVLIAVLGTTYSLLFLNRWIFTNVPIDVFARVWQYYVGYQDVGFARRLLVGSAIQWSPITQLFQNEYIFAHAFHSISILAVSGVALYYILKSNAQQSAWKYLIIFFSPAFIQQMGSTTGNMDSILVLLAAMSFFFVKRLEILVCIALVGISIHELYIFLLPSIILLHAIRKKEKKISVTNLIAIAIPTVFFILITSFGKIDLDKEAYESMMAVKIPLAAYSHSLWSGYFELSTSVHDNFLEGQSFIKNYLPLYKYAILPTLYTILIAWLVSIQKFFSGKQKVLVLIALLFPIVATFFAIDYYRWLGLSANLSILHLIFLMSQSKFHLAKWQWVVLLLFCLLAPMGGNEFHLPFPLHQPLLNKLMGVWG